jgi:hypothetical protein
VVVTQASEEKKIEVTAIELVLARLLRIGSILAAALLAAGIIAMIFGQTGFAPKLITAGLLVPRHAGHARAGCGHHFRQGKGLAFRLLFLRSPLYHGGRHLLWARGIVFTASLARLSVTITPL